MRELIKKILKEYVEPEISIEVIGWYKGSIDEQLLKEWKVSPKKCEEALVLLDNYLLNINPIKTCFFDERENSKRCGTMEITLTNHYIERLFRLEDPLYIPGQGKYNKEGKIINPSLTEGIDLISKNRKTILKRILSENKKNRNNLVLEIKNVDTKNVYNMIVDVNDAQTMYELILVTQIKGTNFINYNRKANSIVKVHTLGDRP